MGKSKTPPRQKKKTTTKWIFAFAVFAIVLVLVIRYFSSIEKDFLLLEKVRPWSLAAAVAFQLLTYVLTALSYRVLLLSLPSTNAPPLPDMIRASVVALFFNQTVPSAGISGNAYFFQYLGRFGIPANLIVLLILSELFIFYIAILSLILLLLFACLGIYKTSHLFTTTLAVGFVAYCSFAVAILLAGQKGRISRLYQRVAKIRLFRKMAERISKEMSVSELHQEIQLPQLLQSGKRAVASVYGLELSIITADVLTIYTLFHGLGIHVSLFAALLAFLCTQILALLPFLPGSLVLYESGMSFFFASMGVPVGSAIVATLLYRFLSFWAPMPLGLLFYQRWLKGSKKVHHGKTLKD